MISPQLTAALYRSMLRIRRVEEEIERIYPSDKIKSPVHLSIGQEAVAVGVCEALAREDTVFGTYRGHAAYLAKGGDLNAMMAELFGKVGGCARGKGGSMHLIDRSVGMMGTSAIVATTIPQAVGYALAEKMRRSGRIVACFFGDGAVEEGVFHESMNFAALKKTPVLFVCENNNYAIYTPLDRRVANTALFERAQSYGMPSRRIESGDVFEIYDAAHKFAAVARAGGGPAFLEVMTCRWRDHVGPGDDTHLGYRSERELRAWKESDQLSRLSQMLDARSRDRIIAEVDRELKVALEFAERSEFPSDVELSEHVFDG